MTIYYSGYLCDFDSVHSDCEYRGRGFKVIFKQTKISNKSNSLEALIVSDSIKVASNASLLIHASLTLLCGNMQVVDPISAVIEDDSDRVYYGSPHVNIACMIACRCSIKNKYRYAIFKYQLACEIHSNHSIDLHPSHREYFGLAEYTLYDNVRMGYAIVLFYSVIEELGLEIRASSKKPAILSGKWNEIVKLDITERLCSYGLDAESSIVWILMHKRANIESKRPFLETKKTEWSSYEIRDIYVSLCDAIRVLSWLRSKVSAHKLGKEIKSVTIYDVANANHLARYIMLRVLRIVL